VKQGTLVGVDLGWVQIWWSSSKLKPVMFLDINLGKGLRLMVRLKCLPTEHLGWDEG
jgi:hypothetical protein